MTDHFKGLLRQMGEVLGDTDAAFGLVSQLQDHSDDLLADLSEALCDDDPLVQAAAAFSLAHLWYVCWPQEIDASSSIPKLLTRIDAADPRLAFEGTRAVAVLQIGGTTRLTEQQVIASYLRCIERADPSLKIEIASQLLSIEPKAVAELSSLLDFGTLQEAIEDVQQRSVRRVLE